MIFWHVGGTIAIFRYVFRDPKVDVRFLALGALLPDLIDKPLGTILLPDAFNSSSQVIGHTLLFSIVLMSVVLWQPDAGGYVDGGWPWRSVR